MRKTGGQVLNDVYNLIKGSELAKFVNGGLHKNQRPFDSKKEDIVISFKTGTDAQLQEGAITVNIYVPDIDNGGEILEIDSRRCTEIESKADGFFRSLHYVNNYRLWLGSMTTTLPEAELKQHFVYIDLRFKYETYR